MTGNGKGMVERLRKLQARAERQAEKNPAGRLGEKVLASVDFSFGDVNQQNLDINDMRWREAPDDIKNAFKQARKWSRHNWFIREILKLQNAFFTHGFKFKAADAADAPALDKFIGQEGGDGRRHGTPAQERLCRQLTRYSKTVCSEWLLQDSVISFWREDEEQPDRQLPFCLMPEYAKYSDAFGVEKLYYAPGYKPLELKADATGLDQTVGLRPADAARYSSHEILIIDGVRNEHYDIITRAMRGQGLSWPGMLCVFQTAAQNESMEVGENQLAMLGRVVIELHKIGFEPRNPNLAPHVAKFLWKLQRAKDINAFMAGSKGLIRLIAGHDHKIEHIWTDPKLYAPEKWDTVTKRLMYWAGPVGWMLCSKEPNPNLLAMLGAEMENDRADFVAPHIEGIINDSMNLLRKKGGMPPVRVEFGSDCFQDVKLAWDMIKTLMTQGALSLHTALKSAGKHYDDELALKKLEQTDAKYLLPIFDASHGERPGQPGRPEGTKNGDAG